MFDDSRRQAARFRFATSRQARFADFPVGGVVLELQREEFQGEGVEFIFVAADACRAVVGRRLVRRL